MTDEQSDFVPEAFLGWLNEYDEYKGVVRKDHLTEQWPNFPMSALHGQTGTITDGELAYYKHDLRRIAEGRAVID